MMKRANLVIIMTATAFGFYSFKESAATAKTSYISFYSDSFNGKQTASGERFDNSKMTAANRTLPFGTKVKITNLKNGKSVTVRINDRGPFHAARVLDVSKAAFSAIENTSSGVTSVEYEVLDN